MTMDASPRHDAAATRPSRYRLTLLPRPDLVGRDAVRTAERYRRAVLGGDAASAVLACLVTCLLVFGVSVPKVYWAVTTVLPMVWLALLATVSGYDDEVLGADRPERRAVARAGAALVVVAATVSYLLHAQPSRSFLLVSAAVSVALCLGTRRLLRHQLQERRRRGRGLHRVLVVGHASIAASAIEVMDAGPQHGYVAVAACLPSDGVRVSPPYGIPVAADVSEVIAAATELGVDAVALVSDLDISGLAARRLAEGLADHEIPLLASGATVAAAWAPAATPVHGLPLVKLGRPARAA
jgi:FlaA1/EpsC-like NDP-sugar epimerase